MLKWANKIGVLLSYFGVMKLKSTPSWLSIFHFSLTPMTNERAGEKNCGKSYRIHSMKYYVNFLKGIPLSSHHPQKHETNCRKLIITCYMMMLNQHILKIQFLLFPRLPFNRAEKSWGKGKKLCVSSIKWYRLTLLEYFWELIFFNVGARKRFFSCLK